MPLSLNAPDLALVLSGGGARAAYQVGLLRHLASRHPDFAPGILTGVSAGGIIAMHLAGRRGSFANSVHNLSDLWLGLQLADVFRVDPADLSARVMRWGLRLVSGGRSATAHARSLVDTTPLEGLLVRSLGAGPDGVLPGVADNLAAGVIRSVALTASSYSTGQSVTWVQGVEGQGVLAWERPQRTGQPCEFRVDHVMASAALPFFFPAVDVDGAWYGDGGIRLTAPLSPAVHLGARRIIAVSTRYARSRAEAERPAVVGYPPPAQVAGVLLNAIFLDLLDADALRLQQINSLIGRLPPGSRDGMKQIDLLVLRPSQDLGRLANAYEMDLPRAFRFLVRGLGSRDTSSNDMLSLLMFQKDYIARLVELGEADAHARAAEIDAFIAGDQAGLGSH
jgi:NTE family protein